MRRTLSPWLEVHQRKWVKSTKAHAKQPIHNQSVMTCAVSLRGAYLVKNGSDEHVPKKPLVINGVCSCILREGKPEGFCHGAALLVGLVESGVEVGQQLVAHLDGSPPCIRH